MLIGFINLKIMWFKEDGKFVSSHVKVLQQIFTFGSHQISQGWAYIAVIMIRV
jgi:hypothetical protein